MLFRTAGVETESVVDGPGIRFVVFFQGCPHHCPGCHNPDTHDAAGGTEITTEEVLARMRQAKLVRGLTLSGGEPFMQPSAALELARGAHAAGFNVVTYTGYHFEELLQRGAQEPVVTALLSETDLLVDGPYLQEQRDISLAFRGSGNQRLLDAPKSMQQGRAILWEKMSASCMSSS